MMGQRPLPLLIKEHCSWLIAAYGLELQPLPDSPLGLVYHCGNVKVTLADENNVIKIYLAPFGEEGHGYELGCVISFIECRPRAGVFSGSNEEQVEKISKLIGGHARLLFGSDFLRDNKEALDEFRVRWLRHFEKGSELF